MISITSCCMISGIKFTDNLFRFPSLFSSDEGDVSMPWRACCLIDVDFGLRNIHSEPCDIVIFSGSMLRFLSPLERLFEAASTILESDEDNLFKSWELKIGKKIILFPGRLTSWKGQEIFLESLNKVNIDLGH